VDVNGRNVLARVHDVSETGIRIEKLPDLTLGVPVVITVDGLRPVAGKVVRIHERTVGVCFEPQRLKTDEVRRLITTKAA
jgi:hypothetical protein